MIGLTISFQKWDWRKKTRQVCLFVLFSLVFQHRGPRCNYKNNNVDQESGATFWQSGTTSIIQYSIVNWIKNEICSTKMAQKLHLLYYCARGTIFKLYKWSTTTPEYTSASTHTSTTVLVRLTGRFGLTGLCFRQTIEIHIDFSFLLLLKKKIFFLLQYYTIKQRRKQIDSQPKKSEFE